MHSSSPEPFADGRGSISDKASFSQDDNAGHWRPHRTRILADHCLRLWWVYLIGFNCVAALGVCLFIWVVIPLVAQQLVNQATLSLHTLAATHTEFATFTLALNATLYSNAGRVVDARFDPFRAALYLEDSPSHMPFAHLDFPALSSHAVQHVSLSQTVNVTQGDALAVFNTWLLQSSSLRVTVAGRTQVKVAGMTGKFGMSFAKTVTMPGLQKLDGFAITRSAISLQADIQGHNLDGYVTIPNRSNVTVELGNVTFATFFNGMNLGNAHVRDVTLQPGPDKNNNFSMQALLSQAPMLGALQQKPYCENGGKLPLTLVATAVENRGQPLPYFADALATMNLTTVIDIGGDIQALGLPVGLVQCLY